MNQNERDPMINEILATVDIEELLITYILHPRFVRMKNDKGDNYVRTILPNKSLTTLKFSQEDITELLRDVSSNEINVRKLESTLNLLSEKNQIETSEDKSCQTLFSASNYEFLNNLRARFLNISVHDNHVLSRMMGAPDVSDVGSFEYKFKSITIINHRSFVLDLLHEELSLHDIFSVGEEAGLKKSLLLRENNMLQKLGFINKTVDDNYMITKRGMYFLEKVYQPIKDYVNCREVTTLEFCFKGYGKAVRRSELDTIMYKDEIIDILNGNAYLNIHEIKAQLVEARPELENDPIACASVARSLKRLVNRELVICEERGKPKPVLYIKQYN